MRTISNPVWNNSDGGECKCQGDCKCQSSTNANADLNDVKGQIKQLYQDGKEQVKDAIAEVKQTLNAKTGCASCEQATQKKKYMVAAGIVLVIGVTAIIIS